AYVVRQVETCRFWANACVLERQVETCPTTTWPAYTPPEMPEAYGPLLTTELPWPSPCMACMTWSVISLTSASMSSPPEAGVPLAEGCWSFGGAKARCSGLNSE